MKTLDCPCGLTLSGKDDDELFRLGRDHADIHPAADNIPDDVIRQHVADNARDAAAADS